MRGMNEIRVSEHFLLSEFQDRREGLVVLHAATVASCEALRAELGRYYGEEVLLIVNCGTRTERSNILLAKEKGWIGDTAPDGSPGIVARDSQHLPHHGGVAVDLSAKRAGSGEPVPTKVLGALARSCFDTVLEYPTHIHADNRHSAAKIRLYDVLEGGALYAR